MTKHYRKEKETETIEKLEAVECDHPECDTVIDGRELEFGNYHTIKYRGGYLSEWPGDLTTVKVDLCEECLKKLIGGFADVTSR